MKANYENLVRELKNKKIRLSHQRLKVLEYLNENRTHPTVDEIHRDLYKEIPTLSKTTIYNTLNALVEAGMVRIVSLGNNESKYDIVREDHGHFKCESCGEIYDFEVKMESLELDELQNFKVHKKDVYFSGLCPRCLNKAKNN